MATTPRADADLEDGDSDLPPSAIQTHDIVHAHPAYAKLRLAAQTMRLLSVGYCGWAVWQCYYWSLSDAGLARIQAYYASIGVDLSGIQLWQRVAEFALDGVSCTLLIAAVAYFWRFLGFLRQGEVFASYPSTLFTRGAWLAVACQASTLLTRPVQSWLRSLHLGADHWLFGWHLGSSDLLGVMFCLTLLMGAYAYTWAVQIAEENRGFV